eukprot:1099923-Prymnesium_polylepis.1
MPPQSLDVAERIAQCKEHWLQPVSESGIQAAQERLETMTYHSTTSVLLDNTQRPLVHLFRLGREKAAYGSGTCLMTMARARPKAWEARASPWSRPSVCQYSS